MTRKSVRVQNRAHLAFNSRHFRDAERVNFRRVQSGGRVLPQHVSVERFAVRQFPNAVIRRRAGQERGEIIDQLLVGWINLVPDRAFHLLLKIGALFVRQLVDLGRARFEGSGKNVLRRRLRDEIGHLFQDALDDETRRRDLLLLSHFQSFEDLIEFSRQSAEPFHIVLAIPRAEEAVRIRHERWELILHPEELVHGIVVPLEFLALGLHREEPIEHAGREALGRVLLFERVGVEVREILPQPVKLFLLMRGRFVA